MTVEWVGLLAGLAATGVHVPEVLAVDTEQGFVLMGDLGRQHYLEALGQGASPEPLYADAIDALVRLQSGDASALPAYDRELLVREMELFPEWFLARHLSLAPDALRSFYEGWTEEEPRRRRRGRRPEGLVLAKPACPPDTGANPIAASI